MADTAVAALCRIPPNPDISGIGVRTAVYAQNNLCFLLAIWAIWDGNMTAEKLEFAEMQTTTNLVLAFAILISSIVQGLTLGMSNHHANIVLMMSWMNNTNAFVYFILYVHHKIGLPEHLEPIKPTWGAWVQHVRDHLLSLSFRRAVSSTPEPALSVPNARTDGDAEAVIAVDKTNDGLDVEAPKRRASALIKRFALVLGSLHLTVMAALGIWLWSDIQAFGIGTRDPSTFKLSNRCTAESAVVALIGQAVPLRSPLLQIFSLVIYTVFILPGINLLIPVVMFLTTYLLCRNLLPKRVGSRREVIPAYIGLAVLFAINVVFIVDIELTLGFNRALRGTDDSEGDWGFGQILAILLLLLPLRDLIEALLSRRLKRRRSELDEDLKDAIKKQDFPALKRAVERGSPFPSPSSPDQHLAFWHLVTANCSKDIESICALRFARMSLLEKEIDSTLRLALETKDYQAIDRAYHLDGDLVAGALYSAEAAVTAFCYALCEGFDRVAQFHQPLHRHKHTNQSLPSGQTNEKDNTPIAALLFQSPLEGMSQAKLDRARNAFASAVQDGEDKIALTLFQLFNRNRVDERGQTTALMHASAGCYDAVVRVLLQQHDLKVNEVDKLGQTALHLALSNGHVATGKLLLERDDLEVNQVDEYGRTALMQAASCGREAAVKLLLEHEDIKVNKVDEYGQTALMLAVSPGYEATVKLLLEHDDIKVNEVDGHGSTALMLAASIGHEATVKLLLERDDVKVNENSKYGRTALMIASSCGHKGTVELLLERSDIQVNLVDTWGDTALTDALREGHKKIAELLLERSEVDVMVVNKMDKSAYAFALGHGFSDIAAKILERFPPDHHGRGNRSKTTGNPSR